MLVLSRDFLPIGLLLLLSSASLSLSSFLLKAIPTVLQPSKSRRYHLNGEVGSSLSSIEKAFNISNPDVVEISVPS